MKYDIIEIVNSIVDVVKKIFKEMRFLIIVFFFQVIDMFFLEKCYFYYDSNRLYEKSRMSDFVFYVQYYVGRIKYNVSVLLLQLVIVLLLNIVCNFIDFINFVLKVNYFLEKNKDILRSDVIELLCESKNRVSIFQLLCLDQIKFFRFIEYYFWLNKQIFL